MRHNNPCTITLTPHCPVTLISHLQEGIDAISDVIQHIETYDVTTIRASTPMFLMSRKIKALGVKMVLSGEGSDEVFGGYLYFHKAPNRVSMCFVTCYVTTYVTVLQVGVKMVLSGEGSDEVFGGYRTYR